MMTLTVFSMDYDGCGCVLNKATLIGALNPHTGIYQPVVSDKGHTMGCFADMANYNRSIVFAVHAIKNALEERMRQYTQGEEAEMYIASLRQCKEHDDNMASKNKNGACFEILPNYAHTHHMVMRPLVLADVEQGDPRHPQALDLALNHPEEKQPTCKPHRLKAKIIISQLQDIARNHPYEEVNFVFFDDDKHDDIIPHLQEAIKAAYEDPILKRTLPSNINIHLQKYNWAPILKTANHLNSEQYDEEAKMAMPGPVKLRFKNSKEAPLRFFDNKYPNNIGTEKSPCCAIS